MAVELPPTMSQGLITLIPKPDKDLLMIENWQPITLTNNDAKLLSLCCKTGTMSQRNHR